MAENHCDAFRNILIRMEEAIAKGHDASKRNLAQKAKVGNFPCCAGATHIALPPTYLLGESSAVEEKGLSLSTEDGPWARRRLAALTYVLDYGEPPLPKSSDWANRSLKSAAPRPFLRVYPPGSALVDGTIAPAPTLAVPEAKTTSPESNWTPTPAPDAPLSMNSEDLIPPAFAWRQKPACRLTRTPKLYPEWTLRPKK